MSKVRIAPTVVEAFVNMENDAGTGNPDILEIDEDPTSPDSVFAKATSNNVNTELRVSFPTPDDPLTTGLVQQFRARVEQFSTGQTGHPNARIELWEAGVMMRAGPDTEVVDAGIDLTFDWNKSELDNDTGVNSELMVIGTKSGGAPGARNSIFVDAVDWYSDQSAGASSLEGVASGS